MNQAKKGKGTKVRAALAVVGMALLAALPVRAASLTEPATVFYGKIWSVGTADPYLAFDGDLQWTIRRADGTTLALRTQLRPLKDGEYSYRLDVPHDALALGISGSAATIALGAASEKHTHLLITVNGQAARILGPSGTSFDAGQAMRAATYRLDLVVGLGAPDVDGNGLPDWWEHRYGLNDPNGDPDGDGLSNLSEYRLRSDPKHDDRAPSLATKEIRAYLDGTTVVRLRAIDADSVPASLVYTLTRAPAEGDLLLRNAASLPGVPDQILTAGAIFSQADLLRSKVVFVHSSASATSDATSFEVVLHDENPEHAGATGEVAVVFYRPPDSLSGATLAAASSPWPELPGVSDTDQPLVASYLLSKEMAYVVADAHSEGDRQEISVPSSELSRAQYDTQYVPSYGPDRRHVLLGGLGSDLLVGGMEDDVIIGGPGNDTLRGNGGSDLFVFTGPDDGSDTIEDFNLAEGDTIDISRVLVGLSPWLSNYVQLATSGTNSFLRIDPNGTNVANPTVVLTLAGAHLTNLDDLVETGRLVIGNKAIPARLTLIASIANASENGPTPGEFRLSRTGSAQSALTVNLQITGSAQNGVDYAYVNPQATFLPGERSLTIEIRPYVDAVVELSEVAQLRVLSGDGYELSATTTAQVTIEDLAPQISIEALEPVAVKSELTPGFFLITRAGVLDRSVLVRLNVTGTASRATDYDGVPTFVNLLPGQTTALLPLTPKSTGVLSNGVEFVQVTIRTDATYRVIAPSSARVILVEEQLTFDAWRDRNFAGANADLLAFANEDPGQTGFRNFTRYAFGLDPRSPQQSPGRPLYQMQDGHLTVTYRQPASVTDVQYAVEISEDLVTWHSGDPFVEPFTAPESATQPETFGFRVKHDLNETRMMFMRVRTTYTP